MVDEKTDGSPKMKRPTYKEIFLTWIVPILLGLCSLSILFLERVTSLVHLFGINGAETQAHTENTIMRVVWSLIIVTLIAAIVTISNSVSGMEKKLEATMVAIQGINKNILLLPEMSKLLHKHDRLLTKSFENQGKLLRENLFETNVLRSLKEIYDEAADKKQKRVYILAALRVLRAVHEQNLRKNFKQIENLNKERGRAELGDISVPFAFLKEIEEELPTGGVWFGVTHLTNPAVWLSKQFSQQFNDFRHHMWRRSSEGLITVFRIYCFSSQSAYDEFKDKVLKEEIKAKVRVKVIIAESDSDFPPDMSLLWSPASKGERVNIDTDEWNSYRIIEDLMKDKNFTPICGLEFEVKSRDYLDSVHIHDPSSKDFHRLCGQFKDAWDNKSKDFSI
jgi:hypothetical protein